MDLCSYREERGKETQGQQLLKLYLSIIEVEARLHWKLVTSMCWVLHIYVIKTRTKFSGSETDYLYSLKIKIITQCFPIPYSYP